jgi:hypothetical protein
MTIFHENNVELKLIETYKLLACADNLNLLGNNRYYKEKHRNFN